jgi:hypothetical protein
VLHFIYYYAECRYAECRYAESRSALTFPYKVVAHANTKIPKKNYLFYLVAEFLQ